MDFGCTIFGRLLYHLQVSDSSTIPVYAIVDGIDFDSISTYSIGVASLSPTFLQNEGFLDGGVPSIATSTATQSLPPNVVTSATLAPSPTANTFNGVDREIKAGIMSAVALVTVSIIINVLL